MSRVAAGVLFTALTVLTQIGGVILLVRLAHRPVIFPKALKGWRRAGLLTVLFVGLCGDERIRRAAIGCSRGTRSAAVSGGTGWVRSRREA